MQAAQTEIINRASLEQMLRVEEEKRKVVVRDRRTSGPRVVTKSTREGDSVRTYVTFTDGPLPPAIDDVAPDYPPQVKCAVTGQPARYFDPASPHPDPTPALLCLYHHQQVLLLHLIPIRLVDFYSRKLMKYIGS